MSYTMLALIAAIAAVFVEFRFIRSGIFKSAPFYFAYAIVLFFQLLTNGYLTSNDIVLYDAAQIIGLRVAFAPVEDLMFGFSLVVLTMAVWTRLGRSEKLS